MVQTASVEGQTTFGYKTFKRSPQIYNLIYFPFSNSGLLIIPVFNYSIMSTFSCLSVDPKVLNLNVSLSLPLSLYHSSFQTVSYKLAF